MNEEGEGGAGRPDKAGQAGDTGAGERAALVPAPQAGTASLPATVANYINSIIGSGMIGIPFAVSEAGAGLGLGLLCTTAVLTDYSLRLLVRAGLASATSSYQHIMEAAFGRVGFVLITILQFVYPFIAMVSYNIIGNQHDSASVTVVCQPGTRCRACWRLRGRVRGSAAGLWPFCWSPSLSPSHSPSTATSPAWPAPLSSPSSSSSSFSPPSSFATSAYTRWCPPPRMPGAWPAQPPRLEPLALWLSVSAQ